MGDVANWFMPKAPKPKAATVLPQRDDEAIRRARTQEFARQRDETASRESNKLTESRLGDISRAVTRTGKAGPTPTPALPPVSL